MYKPETNHFKSSLMIFVGGLESKTTNHDLLQYFGQFGIIRGCEVQCWKNNPTKCRGFALIDIADYPTYEIILQSQHRIFNRPIECKKLIQDKEELNGHNQLMLDRKVFVSGLSKKVDDFTLSDYFSQFGSIEIAYIIKHHKDNKSKGFGFILFYEKESKENALKIAAINGLEIEGKKFHCTSYTSKHSEKEGNSKTTATKFEKGKCQIDKTQKLMENQLILESKEESVEQSIYLKDCHANHVLGSQKSFKQNSGIHPALISTGSYLEADISSRGRSSIYKLNQPRIYSKIFLNQLQAPKNESNDLARNAPSVFASNSQAQAKEFNIFLGGRIERSSISKWLSKKSRSAALD